MEKIFLKTYLKSFSERVSCFLVGTGTFQLPLIILLNFYNFLHWYISEPLIYNYSFFFGKGYFPFVVQISRIFTCQQHVRLGFTDAQLKFVFSVTSAWNYPFVLLHWKPWAVQSTESREGRHAMYNLKLTWLHEHLFRPFAYNWNWTGRINHQISVDDSISCHCPPACRNR